MSIPSLTVALRRTEEGRHFATTSLAPKVIECDSRWEKGRLVMPWRIPVVWKDHDFSSSVALICGSKICILQTLDDCARRRHEQFCDSIPILEPIPILVFHGRSTLSTNAQFFNLFLHSWYSAGRCRKLGTWTWSEEYFIPETHGTFGTNQLWTWVPLWIAGPVPFFGCAQSPILLINLHVYLLFLGVLVKVQACWLAMIFVAKSLYPFWPAKTQFLW